MFYSITVKLPKNKIQQYDMPGPVSVNDLSDVDFLNVIKRYDNHIQLLSKLSELKNGLNDILWEPLSPQKINLITNFYSQDPKTFADVNTYPGENGTVNWKDGITRWNDIRPKISKSEEAYRNLGIIPIPVIRSCGNNFYIPNYDVNPLYSVKVLDPNEQTFEIILDRLVAEGVLQYPLAQHKYNDNKPDFYLLDGIYYRTPHYNTLLLNKKFKLLLDVFTKKSGVEDPIYKFDQNLVAWEEFLYSIPEIVRSEKTYNTYIKEQLERKTSPFPGTKNTQIPVFEYENSLYYVPTYGFLRETNLFAYWKSIIRDSKPIINSFADEVFRQLKIENPFGEIINDGLRFESFFSCNQDPRWNKFINEKYFKIPKNATEEQIKKIKEEIRIRSPKLFLFSSIKPIKVEVIDEGGKKKHCFNLSNEYFENVPDGPWKKCMSALRNDPCKIYEFTIWCDSLNPQVWKGESRTPTEKGDIKTSFFTFLHDRGMNETAYSIDAVLVDENNKIQYMIEFDGTDHFYSKRKDGNPTGKIVSDQVKNRFAREFNIPCVRIPGFRNQRDLNFSNDFKSYIINIIRESYDLPPLQPESETVNSAIYNKSLG